MQQKPEKSCSLTFHEVVWRDQLCKKYWGGFILVVVHISVLQKRIEKHCNVTLFFLFFPTGNINFHCNVELTVFLKHSTVLHVWETCCTIFYRNYPVLETHISSLWNGVTQVYLKWNLFLSRLWPFILTRSSRHSSTNIFV